MERSLLMKVMMALDKREKTQLESFLSTDLYNSGKQATAVLNLWKILEKATRLGTDPSTTKEKVFAELFPQQDFHLGQLEKLMSKLLNLIYQYIHISTENSAEQEVKKQINVYQFLMKKGLISAGDSRARMIVNKLKKAPSTTNNFHQELVFQKTITEFESLRNSRNVDLNLPASLASLDIYYLFYKLELTLQLLTVNNWLSPVDIKDAVRKMDKVLKDIPALLKEDSIFQLHYHAYLVLKDYDQRNAVAFEAFQQKITQYQEECPPDQLKAFQTLSRNYCIASYRRGNSSFIDIGYALYRKHLAEGLLYHKDKILTGTFCNLVLLANWNKDFSWAKKFIENHRGKISGADPSEEVIRFNLAVTAFYENSFAASLDLIEPVYKDRYLKFAAKRLEIMALFELKSDLFEHRLEAFKVFVYRLDLENNLSRTKDENRNFVGILKQIKHPKTLNNKTRIQKLLKKIDTADRLSERLWLRNKVLALG